MKKILILLLIVLPMYIAKGQGIVLQIDTIRQKTHTLCWAACGEMISNFHKQPVSQCDLSVGWQKLRGITLNRCDEPNKTQTVQFLKKEFSTILEINSKLYATEDNIPLKFDFIKSQIAMCKPMALVYDSLNTGNTHAVVIKGYLEDSMTNQWIITNDPNNSRPKEKYINYQPLVTPGYLYQYHSMLFNIHPKRNNSCESLCIDKNICSLPSTTPVINEFVNDIIQNKEAMANLPTAYVIENLTNENHSNVEEILSTSLKIKFLIYKQKIYELQKLNSDKWKIISVSEDDLVDELSFKNSELIIKKGDYELIEIPDFQLSFYKFSDENGNILFSPFFNLPEIEIFKNYAYPIDNINSILKYLNN